MNNKTACVTHKSQLHQKIKLAIHIYSYRFVSKISAELGTVIT
jgi:hypothetical protein